MPTVPTTHLNPRSRVSIAAPRNIYIKSILVFREFASFDTKCRWYVVGHWNKRMIGKNVRPRLSGGFNFSQTSP